MNMPTKKKTLVIGLVTLSLAAGIAGYLIPKPPETRFVERWHVDVNETLAADSEFNSLDSEAQLALRVVTQKALEGQRYEFTADGLLLFGQEGQLLPIARYSIDSVMEHGVSLTLDYLGLREGLSETAELEYSSLKGLTLRRGSHTTVLMQD